MQVNTPYPGWPVLPGGTFRFSLSDKAVLGPGEYAVSARFEEKGRVFSKELGFKIDVNKNVVLEK